MREWNFEEEVVRDGGDVQCEAQVREGGRLDFSSKFSVFNPDIISGVPGGVRRPPGGRTHHHLAACSEEMAEEAVRGVPDRRGSGEVCW